MKDQLSAIPPGWNYNPATWRQRIPIILLAMVGFLIASYLTLYQLDIFHDVWDPFFKQGSWKILNSSVSKILPIPDAALGALGYLADVISAAIGGERRWKTLPWIVVIFGIAVGPLGLISITLVILQPVVFDAWCTLCLASALISVIMIGPSMDELLASLQYLKRVRRAGASRWKAFWGYREIYENIN